MERDTQDLKAKNIFDTRMILSHCTSSPVFSRYNNYCIRLPFSFLLALFHLHNSMQHHMNSFGNENETVLLSCTELTTVPHPPTISMP